jgi:hypothetical protein
MKHFCSKGIYRDLCTNQAMSKIDTGTLKKKDQC